jgi:hypothetical protein
MPKRKYPHLDAPRFAEWFLEQVPYERLTHSEQRSIRAWRTERSSYVRAGTADRWLMEYGLHLDDIPDELWIMPKHRYPRRRLTPQVG